jgi:death on curing protein
MDWIDSELALAFHSLQISEHGGSDGVRDLGLLESALARPLNIHAYEPDAEIQKLAAAYCFGIVKNHPFIDGNKRTGYVVMETFLLLNGYALNATPEEKYLTIIALAEGSISEDDLVTWLKDHVVRL